MGLRQLPRGRPLWGSLKVIIPKEGEKVKKQ